MPPCLSAHLGLCLTLWRTHAQTHTLYFRTSQTALSSTCLQCYLAQSLPGSQIPTVSAHVNSEITGHAHTHICFAFKRVISVCTQNRYVHFLSSSSFSRTNPENKAGEVQRRDREKDMKRGDVWRWWTHSGVMTRGGPCFSAPSLWSAWTSPQWSQTTSPTVRH